MLCETYRNRVYANYSNIIPVRPSREDVLSSPSNIQQVLDKVIAFIFIPGADPGILVQRASTCTPR